MNILVIEDNQDTTAYIATGLQHAGHLVVLADDGSSRLLAIWRDRFDLLIVDRLLPGLDGLSPVQLIREEGLTVRRRFYRIDPARSSQGSGLGLSMVEAISHYHGATLILEDNAPGLRIVIGFP